MSLPSLQSLDRLRHRVPFWWWLTYDALVALVIAVGISWRDPAFWIGMGTLSIAVVIDVVEFAVKRPSARAKLENHREDELVRLAQERDDRRGQSEENFTAFVDERNKAVSAECALADVNSWLDTYVDGSVQAREALDGIAEVMERRALAASAAGRRS